MREREEGEGGLIVGEMKIVGVYTMDRYWRLE